MTRCDRPVSLSLPRSSLRLSLSHASPLLFPLSCLPLLLGLFWLPRLVLGALAKILRRAFRSGAANVMVFVLHKVG